MTFPSLSFAWASQKWFYWTKSEKFSNNLVFVIKQCSIAQYTQCLLSLFQSKMLTPSMLFIMPLVIILLLNIELCSGQNTMDNENGSYSCDTCIIGSRRGSSLCQGCVSGASDAQFSCGRCSPGSDPATQECRGCTNNNPEFGEENQDTCDL